MTEQEKELLLDDLCARLSYSVKGTVKTTDGNGQEITDDGIINSAFINEHGKAYICIESAEYELEDVKPYLRPMSSMTEKERKKYLKACDKETDDALAQPRYSGVDWLNEHHFDYRGLIGMGLALEAEEGMY